VTAKSINYKIVNTQSWELLHCDKSPQPSNVRLGIKLVMATSLDNKSVIYTAETETSINYKIVTTPSWELLLRDGSPQPSNVRLGIKLVTATSPDNKSVIYTEQNFMALSPGEWKLAFYEFTTRARQFLVSKENSI